jgi:hypothetical protein
MTGTVRSRGWSRFPLALGNVNGLAALTIAPALTPTLHTLRIYDRALRTSEVVGNFQARD